MIKEKAMQGVKALGFIVAVMALMTVYSGNARAGLVALSVSDCVKCHEKEPATVERNGGKHKTAVSCLDCHEEHPPWGEEVIPKCSKCHSGKSHFNLENCLACHSDPHEPLALHLADNVTEPCLTCHPAQGEEFKNFPSKHSQKSCTFCHTVHGEIPECSRCHEPHAAGQVSADCLGCHPVHQPLTIKYAITTPRAFCVPCHEEVGEAMSKTKVKHKTFTCAFCHRGQHPVVPLCTTCHGEPHSPATHRQMPNCLECHLDAHNLVK